MRAIPAGQVELAQMLCLAFLPAAFGLLFLHLWSDVSLLFAAGLALAASAIVFGLVRVLGPGPPRSGAPFPAA